MSEPPKVIKSFAMDGYRPSVSQTITRGYPSKALGGHVAPTQSAPPNPTEWWIERKIACPREEIEPPGIFGRLLARRFQPDFGQEPHRGVGVHRLAEGEALRVLAA